MSIDLSDSELEPIGVDRNTDKDIPESQMRNYKGRIFSLVDESSSRSETYSNTLANIDLVPRFVRGKSNNVTPVTTNDPKDLIIQNRYQVGDTEFVCRVKPTIIEREVQGKKIQYHAHPGEREEIIEKVIFKIACSEGLSKIPMPGGSIRWGVKFSLYQIRAELIKVNKTKPYDQIRESLIIIRDSRTTIAKVVGKRELELTASIFQDALIEVTGSGRARDKNLIIFSDYVVEQIMNFNYRQYPFEAINSHGHSLARFFHIYIKHEWTNATLGTKRSFSLNTVFKRYGNAGLKSSMKRRDFRVALSVLVDAGWIVAVPLAQKVRNVFGEPDDEADYLYELEPTKKFVEETRKANAKLKGINILVSRSLEGGKFQSLQKRSFVHAESLSGESHD